MGNCSSANGRCGCCSCCTGDHLRGQRRRRLPKEEHLAHVPGRIVCSDQTSRCASIYTQQGRKGINQDAMLLWDSFLLQPSSSSSAPAAAAEEDAEPSVLCGVFDGHGPYGHLVARKVRDALPLLLLAAMPLNPSADRVHRAFDKAYCAMDRQLRRAHPSPLDCFCSGTTAVTLLRLGSHLFAANVGDSRAVLASSKSDSDDSTLVAVQLTVDLKPDLPGESERIKKCKGRVFALQDEPEVPRVWLPFDDAPGLAMSRAFGDLCLKDHGVISVPEFFHWQLTDRDRFVILASDGVWDVLSNQEAVDIVYSAPSRSVAAKCLVEAANREWKSKYPTSKVDDCAVVCLFLDGEVDEQSDSTKLISHHPSEMCSRGSPAAEPPEDDGQQKNPEPALTRNFTVRTGAAANMGLQFMNSEEVDAGNMADGQGLSCVEGITRVNSLVQLPRFPEKQPPQQSC